MDVIRGRKNYKRWLLALHSGVAATNQTATAGRVLLLLFEVQDTCVIDSINYRVGTTSDGNVTAGIYRIVTEDTCGGGQLVTQSSSVAQGSISAPQLITLPTTTLAPGRYYMALEFSSGTATYVRHSAATQVSGWTQYFDQSYGVLPSTCPAITNDGSIVPTVQVRVVQ